MSASVLSSALFVRLSRAMFGASSLVLCGDSSGAEASLLVLCGDGSGAESSEARNFSTRIVFLRL